MGTEYEVIIDRKALKQIKDLPLQVKKRVTVAIDNLANNPKPSNCKKLQGFDCTWRVRVGDYRIVYEIHDNKVQIIVIRVKHRRDVYRD